MEDRYDTDQSVIEYESGHLEPLQITTSTIAYDSDLYIPYEKLSTDVKADGKEILAVKSTVLELEECINGGEYTRADKIIKKRERNKQKSGNRYTKPARTLAGNQLYFQSSVEFVRRYGGKYHNIRISPEKGSIQIQGVQGEVFKIFEIAESQIMDTLSYINDKMALTEKYTLKNRRIIIINVKSIISRRLIDLNLCIRLDKLSEFINDLMERQKKNEDLPLKVPYTILFVTNPHEAGSYIRVKFVTPIPMNHDRKTTIKIFSSCKINFLGCPTRECPYHIYKFLDKLIQLYHRHIFRDNSSTVNISDEIDKYITNSNKNKYAWVLLVKAATLTNYT